ncbi:MAG: hypothetical protein RLZZ44_1578 [Bacteroidota bacterium]|jgi:uncharacterized membrane protein YqhA
MRLKIKNQTDKNKIMKKVVAIVALALFTVSINAQETKQEKKEMSVTMKHDKKMSADEVAKCKAKCKAEGKKCDAKTEKASGKKCCAKA